MTYLYWSRIVFWSFIVVMLIASSVAIIYLERQYERQEELARQHRRKRRMERFNNINRNR